ncbi:DUF1254 domain-containing protein [Methylobacterium soli]|uniref:DUF1254 domain-containing protein n=1 Tax=Methylobacterium soli TaxID=553447 RepID=A0A6L3SWV8_9HYPH|nr:DUF1254 domain-containing protein [Methylobacterium soli]KAB1078346.1 DUF1254 domain-containing protein [Methylobacterium soli]GJE45884.1 hypothetical protein AEGHOMDF_5084 [Methylobacterium soli]
MDVARRIFAAGAAAFPFVGPGLPRASAQTLAQDAPVIGDHAVMDPLELAVEAYIYGYPLVTMEMTRRVLTNVASPDGAKGAPMGQIGNARAYPDAKFRAVTAPNADTLYSFAFVDVGREPYLFSIPEEDGRYYLMPMLSAWTNIFAVPGKRTTGTGPQTYFIAGPGWSGSVPSGARLIQAPTSLIWILGRTYCTGTPEDYAAVHALQDQYRLIPASAAGKPYTPPAGRVDSSIDSKTAVRDQVNRMDATAYFNLLAALMKDNPPALADGVPVAKMASLGIVPGQTSDPGMLTPAAREAVERAPAQAIARIMGHEKQTGRHVNGWTFTTDGGDYGKDYLQRAFITAVGLGCNLPQDAIYPMTTVDAAGRRLNGASKYVMRFPAGELPPVEGFWSLTMYDSAFFFVENPINRYSVSPRDKLQANPDGSVDLFIQNESPGAMRESNWLPAPEGPFNLMLRTYWPKDALLNGAWGPPPVSRSGKATL